MSRVASDSIRGYLYQFNKCLLDILQATPDADITIEGITEDVEITSPSEVSYIQCKYHESKDTFTLSTIYKPVLQMLDHYESVRAHAGHCSHIRYVLYCHIPGETGLRSLSITEIDEVLNTSNEKLKTLADKLRPTCNKSGFLSQFTIEFGPSYGSISDQAQELLILCGLSPDDVASIFYPNAIHIIAEAAIKSDVSDRVFRRDTFVTYIKAVKRATLSRWTKELKTKSRILDTVKRQLRTDLDTNTRSRYIVFSADAIDQFDDDIVMFVKEFVAKYHFKPIHRHTPLFCFMCDDSKLDEIKIRLYEKSVKCADGMVTSKDFVESSFFREPIVVHSKGTVHEREFDIRIVGSTHTDCIFAKKPDDLFLICDPVFDCSNTKDVAVISVSVDTANELKYLFGMRDTYE